MSDSEGASFGWGFPDPDESWDRRLRIGEESSDPDDVALTQADEEYEPPTPQLTFFPYEIVQDIPRSTEGITIVPPRGFYHKWKVEHDIFYIIDMENRGWHYRTRAVGADYLLVEAFFTSNPICNMYTINCVMESLGYGLISSNMLGWIYYPFDITEQYTFG
jgi:hypothetical protein